MPPTVVTRALTTEQLLVGSASSVHCQQSRDSLTEVWIKSARIRGNTMRNTSLGKPCVPGDLITQAGYVMHLRRGKAVTLIIKDWGGGCNEYRFLVVEV